MYGETGALMREAFAELLRQHRVQQRLGGTADERAAFAKQIRAYRQSVLTWCSQAMAAVSPLTFSNQAPTRANPFRDVATSGHVTSPAGALARAINRAKTESTVPAASIEQLTTLAGTVSVELWRTAAKAAALAEHDTAPEVAQTMTVPQAQAVIADVAAITQALVVLDQRYRHTPGWEQLAQVGRLGWAALAAALDANLGQPDYTVDTLGWRPRVKPIAGPAKPGILGVLQAEHNLLVRMKTVPNATNLRLVIDSQRLLSRHLVPYADRVDQRLADRWAQRADTYVELQRQFRRIRGLTGHGAPAAAEGANAVSRLRALPATTIVEPRVLGGFQMLFDRLDHRIADIVEHGIATRDLVQRVRLPRLDSSSGDLVAPVRERCKPIEPATNPEFVDLLRRRLRPHPRAQVETPGPSRAGLHAALIHRPPGPGFGAAPGL